MTHGTASSSTSGELPTDRNVVGSSGGDASEEASHTFFANDFIPFLLITYLLTTPPLLVFVPRQHMERLVPAAKPQRTAVQV